MNRAELKQQIVDLCEASKLSLVEKVGAVRAALTTVQLNIGPMPAQARSDIVIDGPPFFDDSEICGYCQRPPGAKHEVWCRQ